MRYEPVEPYSRGEAEPAFARDDPDELVRVLLGLSWYEPDWQWVQEQCLRFSQHRDSKVRYIVPLCFMHIARINHELDVDRVFPVLEALQRDPLPTVASSATEYLGDIKGLLFGIPGGVPFVRREELEAELAVLHALEWVTSILRSAYLPLAHSIPSSISPERQLALYREAFEMMRQNFALLGIGEPEQPSNAADDS